MTDRHSRTTIIRTENVHLFVNGDAPKEGSTLVYSFQNRAGDPGLDRQGFGETLFRSENTPVIFVNCISNHWWQYPEMLDVLDFVYRRTGNFDETVCYGSSMGAYAALRFSSFVGATRAVAIAPQFSPRPAVVPLERTYEKDIAGVNFINEDICLPTSKSMNYIVYDQLLKVDQEHARLYQQLAPMLHVKMPGSGHPPLRLLADQGSIRDTTMSLIHGRFSLTDFIIRQRGLRRGTFRYWEQMGFRISERGRHHQASRFMEAAAGVIASHHDEAIALALRFALIAGQVERAKELTLCLPDGHLSAIRHWSEYALHIAKEGSRS